MMMLRTLILLALAITANALDATDHTNLAGGGDEQDNGDDEDNDVVDVNVEIQLDDKPQETSWEVRGPLPGVGLIGNVEYNYYADMKGHTAEETLYLQVGHTYYFLINDSSQDGIQDGFLKIFVDYGRGSITLVEDSTDFGSAKVYMFTVPAPPIDYAELGDHDAAKSAGIA